MLLIRTGVLITILFLSACASTNNQDKKFFVGQNIKSIILRLGTPDQTLHMPGGHTRYVFMTHPRNTFTTPPSPFTSVIITPQGKAIGVPTPTQPSLPNFKQPACTITLETNQQNQIIDSHITGTCNDFESPLQRYLF